MRVTVAGGIKKPLLLNTDEATAVLIETTDGSPVFLLKMLANGKGYIRLVKGEDPNFDETARQLGLI